MESTYERAPSRFIFKDSTKLRFADIQQTDRYRKTLGELTDSLANINSDHNVTDLNDSFVNYLQGMSSECFKSTNVNKKTKSKNAPWFDFKCRIAKREYAKATRTVSDFPSSRFLRDNYYKVKGCYRKIINCKKNKFFDKLNSDIEDGKVLNWQQFKRLKTKKADRLKFDDADMVNFETFFKKTLCRRSQHH